MNKKIILLSALALSMSVSQASLACGCKDAKDSKETMVSDSRYEKITGKLDLTADQKAKIKAIGEKAKADMKPKFEEMRAIQVQLNELAGAKDLDESKIDKLIDQKKEVMGSIMKMRVMTRHDVDMVLTDAQKTKMNSMISDWKEKKMKQD